MQLFFFGLSCFSQLLICLLEISNFLGQRGDLLGSGVEAFFSRHDLRFLKIVVEDHLVVKRPQFFLILRNDKFFPILILNDFGLHFF